MTPLDCPNRATFHWSRGGKQMERIDMVIVFVAFGIMFGAVAAGFTLVSGGSILLAIAAYSGAGTVGALAAIFCILSFNKAADHASQWQEKNENGPVSA